LVNIAEASRPAPDEDPTLPDHLFITSWEAGAKMKVRVDSIEELFVDENGKPLEKCKALATFTSVIDSMPVVDFQDNALNGPLYCAKYCHGGTFGSVPTGKFNMLAGLLASPRDDAYVCAKLAQTLIPNDSNDPDPANNQTPFIKVPKPPGGAAHPFDFGVNLGTHALYAEKMMVWMEAEFNAP
jgi:hypothetical protein